MFEVIEDLEQFEKRFPDNYYLEQTTVAGTRYERRASGEGEGSLYESAWFCTNCGALVDDPFEGCDHCGSSEE